MMMGSWIIGLAGGALHTEPLGADCRNDWRYSGGAADDADPVHSIRSGNPGQHSVASVVRALRPGALVQSIAFSYQYNTGFGPKGRGTEFTVYVADVPVYTSPELTDFEYRDNRSLYSPPVPVDSSGLSIRIPSNGTAGRIEIRFNNNERNVQLKLPMIFQIGCSAGPCLGTSAWSPPKPPSVVYRLGDKDENGTTVGCFRVPAIIKTNDRLLAFAEARYHGCRPDVHPTTSISVRSSLDGLAGERWGAVQIVARSVSNTGLNYPTPLVSCAHVNACDATAQPWKRTS